VPFTASYELCGQCHGDKYRDWKVGVHGKRTGMWNGKKTYYLCVNCHNPQPAVQGAEARAAAGSSAGAGPMSERSRLPVLQDAPEEGGCARRAATS